MHDGFVPAFGGRCVHERNIDATILRRGNRYRLPLCAYAIRCELAALALAKYLEKSQRVRARDGDPATVFAHDTIELTFT